MATFGGHIDFMFLAPPYLASGSATEGESETCGRNKRNARIKNEGIVSC